MDPPLARAHDTSCAFALNQTELVGLHIRRVHVLSGPPTLATHPEKHSQFADVCKPSTSRLPGDVAPSCNPAPTIAHHSRGRPSRPSRKPCLPNAGLVVQVSAAMSWRSRACRSVTRTRCPCPSSSNPNGRAFTRTPAASSICCVSCICGKGRPAGPPLSLAQHQLADRFPQSWQLAQLCGGVFTVPQRHHMRSVRPVDLHHVPKVAKACPIH